MAEAERATCTSSRTSCTWLFTSSTRQSHNASCACLLLHPQERLQCIVMSTSVCVSICLSVHEDISGTTHASFTKFFVHVGAILGIFFPIDSALYSTAFGTHTKTAEPIKMSFGMMTPVGLRYHVLGDAVYRPRSGWWDCTVRVKSDI